MAAVAISVVNSANPLFTGTSVPPVMGASTPPRTEVKVTVPSSTGPEELETSAVKVIRELAETFPLLVVTIVVVAATGCTTLNVADAPDAGAKFPALSLAVPAAIEMPKVPAPVIPEMVTVYEVPEPDNPTVPLAVLVLLSVIFPSAKVLVLKFASL